MLRRLILFVFVATLAATGAFPFLSPRVSSMHIAEGEFWRLPWRAGSGHYVSGGCGWGGLFRNTCLIA